MKKLILLFTLLIGFAVSEAQTTITLTPDTTGTIIGVDNAVTTGGNMHKFTSPVITQGWNWGVYVYVTITGTHATDSTRVEIWASQDGTNYTRLKYEDVGRPALYGVASAAATNTFYYGVAVTGFTTGARLSSAGTGAAGWYWTPSTPLTYRYIQVRIYQLKALSICTVNKCQLHLFKQ